MILDTKKLEELAERVYRKCKEYNSESGIPMGKDSAWAELVNDAIPNLKIYLQNGERDD